jgi:hypothetical protein
MSIFHQDNEITVAARQPENGILGSTKIMKDLDEQTLAKRLLLVREHGYSQVFFRLSAKRYGITAGFFALGLLTLAVQNSWDLFFIVLGFALGALLRDMNWVFTIQKGWAFNDKIINWEKVQQLENKQPSS